MIKLSDGGAYLINGVDIVEDSASAVNEVAAKTGCSVTFLGKPYTDEIVLSVAESLVVFSMAFVLCIRIIYKFCFRHLFQCAVKHRKSADP